MLLSRKKKVLDDAGMSVGPKSLIQESAVHAPIPDVIDDITVLEHGDRGKCHLGIIAALSKEVRMADWLQKRAQNVSSYIEIR